MDDLSDIIAYYAEFDEDGRLDRHPLEFDITWRYLERYLPPGGDLLEVGAATGRYTIPLARRGYRITAVDLSERLTALARERATRGGVGDRITHMVADARDLSALRGRGHDAALVMGPLYHLVHEADRRAVLREVRGLLRDGGVILAAFISRLGILGDVMRNAPETIATRPGELEHVLRQGRDPDSISHGGFRGYFARVDEITSLLDSEGFEQIVLAGVEPAIGPCDEAYGDLGASLRAAWLDLLFLVSAEPTSVGASRHLLYVGRRR